ncbi:MAG: hypothetical protein LC776_10475 [Acidobacteria bacterium]|nr:hypothetical protein [Acidobacteriota bacterium]
MGALVSDPAARAVRVPELLTPVLQIVHRVISGFLIKQAGLNQNQAPAPSR